MVAYFSSKLLKQAQAVLVCALLLVCLVGTHWIGYAHSISHASQDYQVLSKSYAVENDATLSHSIEVCHLFDALSLAGFIPDTPNALPETKFGNFYLANNTELQFAQNVALAYRSRAPPPTLL